jgi:hypothetical protein
MRTPDNEMLGKAQQKTPTPNFDIHIPGLSLAGGM